VLGRTHEQTRFTRILCLILAEFLLRKHEHHTTPSTQLGDVRSFPEAPELGRLAVQRFHCRNVSHLQCKDKVFTPQKGRHVCSRQDAAHLGSHYAVHPFHQSILLWTVPVRPGILDSMSSEKGNRIVVEQAMALVRVEDHDFVPLNQQPLHVS
jgi:hypothetical protein